MTQTTSNTAMNLTAVYYANPVCVTAFITPQSLLNLPMYSNSPQSGGEAAAPVKISVGVYMSDHSITRICNFTNAANALNYAFMLKGDNCPISKNAMALIKAEIKRTGAVSTRAQARAEAKARQEAADVKPGQEATDAKPQEEAEEPLKLQMDGSKTPLFAQYEEMKKKHPDAVLLFRVGDFYETFGEDAQTASDILGITLTARANGSGRINLAGFPHHALDTYLPRLVRAGKRVAICEQLEEPKKKTKKTKRA